MKQSSPRKEIEEMEEEEERDVLENFYNRFEEHIDVDDHSAEEVTKWRHANELLSSPWTGIFHGNRQENTYNEYRLFQPLNSLFSLTYAFVGAVIIVLISDNTRRGSLYDFGESCISFRFYTSLVVIALLGFARILLKTGDEISKISESNRLLITNALSIYWFSQSPWVHQYFFAIPIADKILLENNVVWTLIQLTLTSIGASIVLKLSFVAGSKGIIFANILQLLIVFFASKPTSFIVKHIFLSGVLLFFCIYYLKQLDIARRDRFLRIIKNFEVDRTLRVSARRFRSAQAFAPDHWNSDYSVVSLGRIRDDPTFSKEGAFKSLLDIGIETIVDDNTSAGISPLKNQWKGTQKPAEWFRGRSSSASPTSLKPKVTPILTHHRDHTYSHSLPSFETEMSPQLPSQTKTQNLTEKDGLVEYKSLETLMSDWEFGSSSGLWSHVTKTVEFPRFVAQPLVSTMLSSLNSFDFFDTCLGEDALLNKTQVAMYFKEIESAYRPREEVPYHNHLHAVDVVQTVFSMLKSDVAAIEKLPRIAKLALLIGAAVHDVGHPGLNNAHLINVHHGFAITYNDRSVLENYHVSLAFKIMNSSREFNILSLLKEQDRKRGTKNTEFFRSLLIQMILHTDLSHHFDEQARFRARLDGSEKINFSDRGDVALVCSALLHAADIGNVGKNWESYFPWIDLLFTEFFAQGDLEKQLGIDPAPFMDRDLSIPEKAQIAFVNNIALPYYLVLRDFIPVSAGAAIANMQKNLIKLDRKVREKEASRRTSSVASLETITAEGEEEESNKDAFVDLNNEEN